MKTNFFLTVLIVLLSLNQGFAQTQNTPGMFTLTGILTGAPADSVTLSYQNDADSHINKTAAVTNGRFIITGNIAQPVNGYMQFKFKGRDTPRDMAYTREIFLEPAMITITGDPADLPGLKITGSKSQAEMDELDGETKRITDEEKPLDAAIKVAYKAYDDALKNKAGEKVIDSLHDKANDAHDAFDPYNDTIKRITYKFFLAHPDSYVTAFMMRFYTSRMSLDSTKTIYNNFSAGMKATPGVKAIAADIAKMEAGSPGSMAPNFTANDINGRPLALNSFKGKYVMLDFWASWCVPCRKSNPHMIVLYNKYHAKGLDVIGIADDDGKPAIWKAAIAKDNVGIWHNVMRGLNWDMIRKNQPNPNDISELYGISSIPTKILIDPSGKIIGRFGDNIGGTEADMDEMLASVFNK